ncbi:MAG: hypothetical protein AAFP89_02300 [Bacteroidota bacterium]
MKNLYPLLTLAFCFQLVFATPALPIEGPKTETALTILSNTTGIAISEGSAEIVLNFKRIRTDEVSIQVYNAQRRCIFKDRQYSVPQGTQLNISAENWTQGEYIIIIKQGFGKCSKIKYSVKS